MEDADTHITWKGDIVESVFMNNLFDGTGREAPQKYMAIVSDEPQCSTEGAEKSPEHLIVLIWPGYGFKGPSKWLGHHVEIRGLASIPGTAHYPTTIAVSVEEIKDSN
jgi:hypothetical protein